MTPPSTAHHERDQLRGAPSQQGQGHEEKTRLDSPSASHLSQPHRPPPITSHPYNPYGIPHSSPLPALSTSVSMASAATLPPTDILTPRLPAHPMSGMYHPASTSRSPSMQYDHRPYTDYSKPRENVRYEPYADRRRVSGRPEEKITLPSLAGLAHDPYAPRQVLPSIQPYQPAWGAETRLPSRGQIQLPSLRSISGESSPTTSRPPPHSYGPPRDPYLPPPLSPSMTRPAVYSQPSPLPSQQHPLSQQPLRPHTYPYHPPALPPPPPRKTHPPPHDPRNPSPPVRVKHEPDSSPPLRSAPLSQRTDERYFPAPVAQSYSPTGPRVDYADTRRGSVVSLAGEGKEQVVGQTRRLAHLMSEQKRRESINTGFHALRSALPLALPTDSKAIILRKALARIEELEARAGIASASSHRRSARQTYESETSSTATRPDWRTGGGLHPQRMDERVPSGTSQSSSSSRPQEAEGRYNDEWAEARRGEYEESPGSEMGDGEYDGVQPDGEAREWADEEMQGRGAYSQERRGSIVR